MKKKNNIPSSNELLDFILKQPDKIRRRDIAKAFGIRGQNRVILKNILKELDQNPLLKRQGKNYSSSKQKSERFIQIQVSKIEEDIYGFFIDSDKNQIEIKIIFDQFNRPANLKVNDQIIVKIILQNNDKNLGQFVRKIDLASIALLGIYRIIDGKAFVVPTARKSRDQFFIPIPYQLHAQEDDLVEYEPLKTTKSQYPEAKIVRIIGSMSDPKSMSLIAIHTYNLPNQFSDEALMLAQQAQIPSLKNREDLRSIPLVTIDDEDARDFDDAVWAELDTSKDNPGGWHLIVAIADVSFYVKPNDALDKEAYKRGNSVYFPDCVVPMLPEVLSNTLCSLKPDEDRACLAVHLWINKTGKLLKHRFTKGLMRSAQRLTYQKTQEAFEGKLTSLSKDFNQKIIYPLYGAYECLLKGKNKRAPLNLDVPEQRIYLNNQGEIDRIIQRPRFDSHRLIEEFMILANVAAAITLNDSQILCMYRVHDQPTPEKVEILHHFLRNTSLSFAKGQVMRPSVFNKILAHAINTPYQHAVNELVLRTQAQAVYSPDNIGHFGLNLPRYAHFTSPIRRYADLLVHRALGEILEEKNPNNFPYSLTNFQEIASHISITERRASAAERETVERYITAYLTPMKDQVFETRIVSITPFALFVRLNNIGAEGMIPLRLLNDDYYIHDPIYHQLIGRRTKKIYKMGDILQATLIDADKFKGSLMMQPAQSFIKKNQDTINSRKPKFRRRKSANTQLKENKAKIKN